MLMLCGIEVAFVVEEERCQQIGFTYLKALLVLASDTTYFNAPGPRCDILDVKNLLTRRSYLAYLLLYLKNVRTTKKTNDTNAMRSNLGLSNFNDPATAKKESTLTMSKTKASAGRNTNFVFGSTASMLAIGTS
mmetsp:Transcript_19042/g.32734  ORF Transcript_19042/g.32734 Transcript_19042/m.32734 type:complete len:134 (+) Transcript_19042:503-904(+)